MRSYRINYLKQGVRTSKVVAGRDRVAAIETLITMFESVDEINFLSIQRLA